MLPVPACGPVRSRDLFTTEVGPDDSGSKPGIEGCNHTPETSGIDAPLCAPLAACRTWVRFTRVGQFCRTFSGKVFLKASRCHQWHWQQRYQVATVAARVVRR